MNKKLLRKDGYPTKYGTIVLMTVAHRDILDVINPCTHYFGKEIGLALMEAANKMNEILKVEVPKYKDHE